MGIGTLRCAVIDVDDLDAGFEFWSAVTGLEVIGGRKGGWHGRFGYLGTRDPWKHEIILQRRDPKTGDEVNRVHVDITPNGGIDTAIEQILALGGSVRKAPSLYPRPGARDDELPVIDWAVMRDPFGNEFCLVSELTEEEIEAVRVATQRGATTDQEWRRAAGRTV